MGALLGAAAKKALPVVAEYAVTEAGKAGADRLAGKIRGRGHSGDSSFTAYQRPQVAI